MGLQITVLLTMVIFVEVLQTNIPVFGFLDKTPVILIYFIVTILLLCFCLLLTTFTLFLHHINEYDSKNFSKTEAKISVFIARLLNLLCCRIWVIEPPGIVTKIASHPTDDIHVEFDHEQDRVLFKFLVNEICRDMVSIQL